MERPIYRESDFVTRDGIRRIFGQIKGSVKKLMKDQLGKTKKNKGIPPP
jgi:hypothetical protein